MTAPTDIIATAFDLLAAGRRQDAVAMMRRAAREGSAVALFELAIWTLIGDPLERDLPGARALLRQAREAGHADAGLMEAAITANGTGAAPDWPAALRILTELMPRTPLAGKLLELLQALRLTADGHPERRPTGQPLDAAGIVTRFPQLLTAAECEHVARVAAPMLEPALVVDPATGRQRPHPVRTSDGGVIGPTREDPVVRAINLRLAAATETDVTQGEALTVLRYAPGQQYRLHLDTLPGVDNQRLATVLIYLNDGFAGGVTTFPELDLTITPRRGDAIFYRNLAADGRPDPRTQHAGLPVTRGVKWLATRWIRLRPLDPWNPLSAR